MKRILILIICSFLFLDQTGCNSSTKSVSESQNVVKDTPRADVAITTEADITGKWKNISMKITYMNIDSVYNVPEGKWEEILGIKPIITTYNDDHTFTSEYYTLNDSLISTSKGTWKLGIDSLSLTTDGNVFAYKILKEGAIGEFTGILDWNGDGKHEEIYYGKQEKVE